MSNNSKKPLPLHKDLLGRTLAIGQYVALPHWSGLSVGRVVKINPKMVGVDVIQPSGYVNKYPRDLVILEDQDITWYLLKIIKN